MRKEDAVNHLVHGYCRTDLADVRDAFAAAVDPDGPGAALAVWHDGALAVDLWSGRATATTPWTRDTLAMPYSVTKAFTAVCALLLVERGQLDLDEPARTYWPQVRWDATVRQLLSHSAGIVALDEPAPTSAFYDWDGLCDRLARQQPSWPPGAAVGESAVLFGHLVGELVRRVDGRTVGTVLRDEIARPLDLDLHIGVPASEHGRVADLVAAPGFPSGSGGPLRASVLGNPPGVTDTAVVNSVAWRQAEIPAVNAHVTARAVASFYAAVAGGRVLPAELVTELSRVQAAGDDCVLGSPARWGLGVAIESDGWGMGGIGGSLGWWSEEAGYALGFVTAHLDTHERSARIENALRGCLGLPPLDA